MYTYSIVVQFEDIDSYGIIHHPKVLYYMERARVNFFNDNGISIKTEKNGLVLRNINIQLKSQILMFDTLILELTTKHIDTYRFTFHYEIKRSGKLMTVSETEMVIINLETKKLIPIPEHILKVLKQIQSDAQ